LRPRQPNASTVSNYRLQDVMANARRWHILWSPLVGRRAQTFGHTRNEDMSSRRRWTTDDDDDDARRRRRRRVPCVRASRRIILDAGMSKRQDSSHVFSPLFVSLVGWWTIRHHLRHMHDPPCLLVGGSLLSCRPHRHKRLALALLLLSLPAHGPRPPSGREPKKNLACSAFPNYSSLHTTDLPAAAAAATLVPHSKATAHRGAAPAPEGDGWPCCIYDMDTLSDRQ